MSDNVVSVEGFDEDRKECGDRDAAGRASDPASPIPALVNNYTATGPAGGPFSITFTGGLPSAGNYVVRFFSNDGFFLLDEVPFTVGP